MVYLLLQPYLIGSFAPQPLVHFDNQITHQAERQDIAPVLQADRRAGKQLIHQRNVGEEQLQDEHPRYAYKDPPVGKEANLERGLGE